MSQFSRRRWLSTSSALLGSALIPLSLQGCANGLNKKSRAGLNIVFYTDVHATLKHNSAKAIMLAAEKINLIAPNLILGGGDYIDGGFTASEQAMAPHWDIYQGMHQTLQSPVFPAIGNHDLVNAQLPDHGALIAKDPRRSYRQIMGLDKTWYSFDDYGYHFIVLDSMNVVGGELGYEGRIDSEQWQWLEQDLANTARSKPIVVTLHMPLLTNLYAATKGNLSEPPANRVMVDNIKLLKLFEKHNLILVLQGHLHIAEVMRWRNTTFITGGAICGNWWRGQRLGTEEGFYSITLQGSKVIWNYIDYGWEV